MDDFHINIITTVVNQIKEDQSTAERLMIARASMVAGVSVMHAIKDTRDSDSEAGLNRAIEAISNEIAKMVDDIISRNGE